MWYYLFFILLLYLSVSFIHPYLPLLLSLLIVSSFWFVDLPLTRKDFSFGSVYVFPSSRVGAFSLGNKIVFTEGMLELFSEDELKAVYYHELSHVKNKDQIILILLVLIFLFFYNMIPSIYLVPYIVSVFFIFVWFYWQIELRADVYAYVKAGPVIVDVLKKVSNFKKKFRLGISLHPPISYRIRRLEEFS